MDDVKQNIEQHLHKIIDELEYQTERNFDDKEALKILAVPTLVTSVGMLGIGVATNLTFLSVLGIVDSALAITWGSCLIKGIAESKVKMKIMHDVIDKYELEEMLLHYDINSYSEEKVYSNGLKESTSKEKVLTFKRKN